MNSTAKTRPTQSVRRLTAPVVTAAHSLLPISDVVVYDAFGVTGVPAGIRTWSPPV